MRILIIEDESKIANALKRGLTQEHYAVDVAYDGDDGLSSALGDEYDLIVLDRMLPGSVDGIDISRILRDKKISTPILMLTAKDRVSDRIQGLDSGADDYLVKPFSFEELLARIRALLRRPKNNLGIEIKVGDLVLDTTSSIVKRQDKEIALSSKEFALLEYLMRNQGRILSKESIIDHVWDFDSDILPNTVEAYIGYLRNKIEKPFKGCPELIHTVRGFGYRIGEKK